MSSFLRCKTICEAALKAIEKDLNEQKRTKNSANIVGILISIIGLSILFYDIFTKTIKMDIGHVSAYVTFIIGGFYFYTLKLAPKQDILSKEKDKIKWCAFLATYENLEGNEDIEMAKKNCEKFLDENRPKL
jgi:hypothetical protein